MSKTKSVERDGGNCIAQADGDPGWTPTLVVYVDRRGQNKTAERYHGESDTEFGAIYNLEICEACGKFCEPVLTEERRRAFTPRTEAPFCYHCDFSGRVRVLVEDGFADVGTASMIVHRLIAFEHPGADVERVVIVR